MSKELEYIQRQINIVKQQVKGSKIRIIVTDTVTKHQYDYYERELQTLESIEQDLQRLESIDNANPSKALECLEELEKVIEEITISNADLRNTLKTSILIATIKQALLKQQEPKQYLKWEDLDFKEVSQLDNKIIKAKLNGQLYELELYRYGGYKRVEIRAVGKSYNYNCEGYVICIDEEFPETIHFFNDLHLERVEE